MTRNLNGTQIQKDTQTEANGLNQEYFGQELQCPLVFNNRLSRAEGRFHPISLNPDDVDLARIELNPDVLTLYGKDSEEITVDIIKHELCHYNLWLEGKPYGHNRLFYRLMHRVHCHRFAPVPPLKTVYEYQCVKCGEVIAQEQRMHGNYYVHKGDNGHFRFYGKTIYKDFVAMKKRKREQKRQEQYRPQSFVQLSLGI